MYILGISALRHNPAAALLSDGRIVAAIEESKLQRVREYRGIPREAIAFCLAQSRMHWKDVRAIAIATDPLRAWTREVSFRFKEALRAPISSTYYQMKALGDLVGELNNLRVLGLLPKEPKLPLIGFEHALCHAASAFYASPFERALILTLDEEGDGHCVLIAQGEGTQIRELHSIRFPHSLAWVYSQITQLLKFTRHSEEHKTQWLSLTGQPIFSDLFLEMLSHGRNRWPVLNRRYFRRGFVGEVAFSKEFYARVGIHPGEALLNDQMRADLAASLQQACSVIVSEMLEDLRRKQEAKFLCLGGGLFLNPLLVAAVERNAGFEEVFVQPAAANEGTALGAAWLAYHQAEGKPRSAAMERLDWGPSYSHEEIKQVLDNCKAAYHWADIEDRMIEEIVKLLRRGKIVGWFQGAAEFGPRALGNRSLLASPWASYVQENLNSYVKHRESFQPFALQLLFRMFAVGSLHGECGIRT